MKEKQEDTDFTKAFIPMIIAIFIGVIVYSSYHQYPKTFSKATKVFDNTIDSILAPDSINHVSTDTIPYINE